MKNENCLIVGASHAGVSLALQLRKEGWTGAIQLISAESELPYHRPPLSKDFLAGAKTADSIRLRPEQVYSDNAIELLLNIEVTAIDRARQVIRLNNGQSLGYAKLALCVGARVRKLPIADRHANIFYIRTLDDVTRLSAHVQSGRRALIIGGGYIGLEAAAQMIQKRLAVTVLEASSRILGRVAAPILSDYYSALHAAYGVAIHNNAIVNAIVDNDHSSKVFYNNGSEIEADFIIIGIGIAPNIALAAESGLQVGEGIVVNEFAQTSDPNIYAAGDCTEHPSALYQRTLRLESVQNANDQARIAAASICGKNISYDSVPWFWSDQYAIKLQTAGINTGYDSVIARGDTSNASGSGFVLFYLKDGNLLAADCINRPKEFMASKQIIRSGKSIDQQLLIDEAIDLTKLV